MLKILVENSDKIVMPTGSSLVRYIGNDEQFYNKWSIGAWSWYYVENYLQLRKYSYKTKEKTIPAAP